MKSWKIKLIGLVLTLALLVSLASLMETPAMASPPNVLYFDPDPAEVSACSQSIDVKLMAEIDAANPVITALLTFTFDNTCLEITGAVGNTEDWKGGGTISDLEWVNANGSMTITASVGINPPLTGTIEVATLTLHCINCDGCTALFDLTVGEYTTEMMQLIYPDLNDGSFTCPSTFAPSPPGGGNGGGGVQPGLTYLSDYVTIEGKFGTTVAAMSDDGKVELTINKGTVGKTKYGGRLTRITMLKMEEPSGSPPADCYFVGFAYDIGPDGATFDQAATITIIYNPDEIPEGYSEANLVIAMWDKAVAEWIMFEDSTVDPASHTVSTSTSHFTPFAVIAQLPPAPKPEMAPPSPPPPKAERAPAPANFAVSDLSITPGEVRPGEQVTISAVVSNTGDSEGSYTVILKINDVEEARKEVTLGAGKSETVSFTIAKDTEGSHTATIDGKAGQFTIAVPSPPTPPPAPTEAPSVQPPTTWWLIGGGVAAVLILCLVSYFSLRKRG